MNGRPPNYEVNWTAEMLRISVPSALRAPAGQLPRTLCRSKLAEKLMRAVERKPAKGSLHWLREAVSARSAMSGVLDERIRQACGLPARAEIKWRSPLEEDDYAEYRDHDFLALLGLELEHRPLESFWPNRGPQWDALARTSTDQIILVEAKANIPEIVSPGTSARAKSRTLIEKSLFETRRYLRVPEDIPWSGRLYQYANRIAHLYLLRELNGVDAHLV